MHGQEWIMAKLICPSIFNSVSFDYLRDAVLALDAADTDIFHLDVMDGSFVQNFALSPQDITTVRNNTKKLIDVHLMINNPGRYVDMFADLGVDIIYVHPEAEIHATRTLDTIRKRGRKSGIAVSPGFPVTAVEELMPLVDYIMVMGVNPGFAGQKFIDHVEHKIARLSALRSRFDFKMILDGGVSFATIERFNAMDLDGFIAGFDVISKHKPPEYRDIFDQFRRMVGGKA
jgi:ribulose-phosphate 3-epimerase